MENRFLKAMVPKDKQRGFGALLLFLFLGLFTITTGSAQLPNQKHVTAVQMAETAEGSRVTIVSDSALSDYEAFRRGDRFYVKIPMAELRSGTPRCCASGFDNVQVQKVGDGIIVSFKLQPGATARVDLRSNRLDVVFSSPNKTFRNDTTNLASNRGGSGTRDFGTSQARGVDAGGPVPPGSMSAFRPRGPTEGERVANQSRSLQNQAAQTGSRTSTGPNQSTGGNNQSSTGNNASGSPFPVPSSSSSLAPSSSSTNPSSTSVTPAESVTSQPTNSSSTASGSNAVLNWRTRSKGAVQWVLGNRLATLLGALILLSLILYLAAALRRRQTFIAAKRRNAFKVQPKVHPDQSLEAEFDELLEGRTDTSAAPGNLPKENVKTPAIAPAVIVVPPPTRNRGLAKPSIVSPSAGHERGSNEEDREVFEL